MATNPSILLRISIVTYFWKWNNHSASAHMIKIMIQALEFQICVATLPASPKISAKRADFKSAISPSSGLRFHWLFFRNHVFFPKYSRSTIRSGRSCTRTSRSAPQNRCPENCLQSHWFLNQRYLLHPDSDLTNFFFWIWVFFHKKYRSAIRFCISRTKMYRSYLQIRRRKIPAKNKNKKITLWCPRKCYDTNCYRSNPEIL